jgi:hypothetical protein
VLILLRRSFVENLNPKEKPMTDETLKALWNQGIEMMAQGYT